MQTYGVHKYFILRDKTTQKMLSWAKEKSAKLASEDVDDTDEHTRRTAEPGLQKTTCEKHDR